MNTKKAQGVLSLRAENPNSIIEHELRKQDLYDNKSRIQPNLGKENEKAYSGFFDEDEIAKRQLAN